MKISFPLKIGGSFGLILIVLLLSGSISFVNLTRLNRNSLLVAHTHDIMTKIEELFRYLADAEIGERGYIITGEEKYLGPYKNALPEISDDLNDLKQLILDPDQQQRLSKLESMVTEKLDFLEEAINARKNAGFDSSRNLIITDIGRNIMGNIRDLISEMKGAENQLLQARQQQSENSVRLTRISIILFTAVSILIVVLLVLYLTSNIALPIKKISGFAEAVSIGDLGSGIEMTSRKDEIGVLLNAFSRMILYLREMTTISNMISERNLNMEIKPLSEKDVFGNAFRLMKENLKAQVVEISETVNVLTSMVAEIIATSTQLTTSSTETVSAISETTTTMEEMKQTAQLSNEKAKSISEGSKKTLQVARDGEKAVSNTGIGMNRIREKMEFIAESIMRLSEQSQAIGEIMNTINDLAEQSNLLAVNASIEAAKAGEEGKGFAVVAEEVKRLADQSKQATRQVREILTDVQKATSTAVMATEEGSKVVESGIRQADDAGASIKVLTEVINEAVQATTQIGASVQQQFVGINQVNEAIRNISVASNHNLQSTRQLEEASEKLEGVANSLEKLVKLYQL